MKKSQSTALKNYLLIGTVKWVLTLNNPGPKLFTVSQEAFSARYTYGHEYLNLHSCMAPKGDPWMLDNITRTYFSTVAPCAYQKLKEG